MSTDRGFREEDLQGSCKISLQELRTSIPEELSYKHLYDRACSIPSCQNFFRTFFVHKITQRALGGCQENP